MGDVTGVDHVPVPVDSEAADDDCPPLKHRFELDAAGRLIKKTTADGVTDYTYDSADNLLSITFTDLNSQPQPLSFSYDKNGQLLSENSAAGELQYQHDSLRKSLKPLQYTLRRALGTVLQPRAVSLPIETQQYGVLSITRLDENANVISSFAP